MSVIKILDPIVDLQYNKYYACLKGGSQTTKRKYDFQSFSNSSSQLAFTTPSPYTFMSKKWLYKQPVTITFTGNSGDPARGLIQSGQDSFRSFPIMSVLNVLDIKLNGQSSNLNISDIIKPLLLYHNSSRDLGEREMSMTPSYRDQSQAYSQLDGSIRNPLASYFDSNGRDSMGRGGFAYTALTNTQFSAVVQADLIEELLLSPLAFGNNREIEGFINLQDVELNFTWDNDLSRMWSHSTASSSVITSIVVDLGRPTLEVTYVTPEITQSIPRSIDYPYMEIKRYVTSNPVSLPPSVFPLVSQTSIVSNNLQVGAIPRFLYIFLRKRNQDRTFEDTDSYAKINSIQVDWDNQNALLSSATTEQLYDISRKNGIDINYTQFTCDPNFSYLGDTITQINGIGSVISIEFGTDIGLKPYECAGLRDTFNLQVTVNYQNNHPTETIFFDLYLVTIIPGIFRIFDRSASRIVGIISKQDVLNAVQVPGIDYEDLEKRLLSGSSKFSKALKRFAKKGYKGFRKGLRTTADVARDISEITGALNPFVAPAPREKKQPMYYDQPEGRGVVGGDYDMLSNDYMYGGRKRKVGRPKKAGRPRKMAKKKYKAKPKSKMYMKRKMAKVRSYKKKKKGGALVGGEYMSKRQLLNRLMQY